jgi:hypothetical protein
MPFLPGKVSFWRPLADHRAPDGGVPHAAAPGDEAISTSGMTAKEDKKTPARVGREPELILAQPWGRPSLAGGVLCVDSAHPLRMLYFIFHDLLQAMWQTPELRSGFHKTLLSNIL